MMREPIQSQVLFLLFLVLLLIPEINSYRDSFSSPSSGRKSLEGESFPGHSDKIDISNRHAHHRASNVSFVANLVEIYEHEFYDSNRDIWVGGSGHNKTQRWTSSPSGDHHKLPPPPQLLAPKGYEYTSEWKIDITGSSDIRDELGWEYFIDRRKAMKGYHINGRRRRRWLRSVSSINQTHTSNERNDTTNCMRFNSISSRRREILIIRKYINEKIWKEIVDSFNFKGWGCTFQKSMISRKGCAIIVRLPLTVHFDFFETRPWLPLISSSCAFSFPFSGSFSINASLPMAIFRYIILTVIDQMKFIITFVWYVITKIILIDIVGVLILSNLVKLLGFGQKTETVENIVFDIQGDISKKKKLRSKRTNDTPPSLPTRRDLQYSSRISERLGLSVTWQCSKSNGVDFKIGWWHCLLPTIDYINEVSTKIINQYSDQRSKAKKDSTLIQDWLRQKVGSLGFVWGQSTIPPAYSCNAALSLSGFYYGGQSLKMLHSLILAVLNNNRQIDHRDGSNKFISRSTDPYTEDILIDEEESEAEILDIVKVSTT